MVPINDSTALILAGGKSRRMGCNKALLQLKGMSMLQWQVRKLQHLGIREILISGPEELMLPGTRTVPDRYPGCGPIGGLQAGLEAASSDSCLVIGVDYPLVPEETLRGLFSAHTKGITILRHQGWDEPLLGIYDRTAAPLLEDMILQGIYAVRAVEKTIPVRRWDYSGPEEFLCNCNSLREYEQVGQILMKYRDVGTGLSGGCG